MAERAPVMTQAEWDKALTTERDWSKNPLARDQLAAVALFGEPGGFTWEMIDSLRECVEVAAHFWKLQDSGPGLDHLLTADKAIANLAALLPPRPQ